MNNNKISYNEESEPIIVEVQNENKMHLDEFCNDITESECEPEDEIEDKHRDIRKRLWKVICSSEKLKWKCLDDYNMKRLQRDEKKTEGGASTT